MPVLLEQIRKPSEADWVDLEKIHNDTAQNGFTLNPQQLQQWLDEGGWVMAGRFNDRLIGALLAKKTPAGIELSQAGVRSITQRRGVMHQMLHFICAWSKGTEQSLIIKNCPSPLASALTKRGFSCQDGVWRY